MSLPIKLTSRPHGQKRPADGPADVEDFQEAICGLFEPPWTPFFKCDCCDKVGLTGREVVIMHMHAGFAIHAGFAQYPWAVACHACWYADKKGVQNLQRSRMHDATHLR
jgi:hypothetical protein